MLEHGGSFATRIHFARWKNTVFFNLAFFSIFRSALQISMSESNQLKSNQLVPSTSNGRRSELDDVFSGLGLGSYVGKKDTGAIATSMMPNNTIGPQASTGGSTAAGSNPNKPLTLADKQRMLKESEIASKMGQQGQLKPMMTDGGQTRATTNTTKDLTASLMQSNLNQMKHSQTMSSMPSSHSPSGFGSTPMASNTMMGGWGGQPQIQQPQPQLSMWGQPMLQMQNQPHQQAPKPDLSAFDSLLPNSKATKQSMNSMIGQSNTMGMSSMMNMKPQGGIMQPQGATKPPVKSLTANDITDLLN